MEKDNRITLVVGDLGYHLFDRIREDFPDRFYNVGASESALLGTGAGLALEGRIPFLYSISPFLLWRPAETIRLYVDHEKIPVKLIGSGRDTDYSHDGFSHDATDAKGLLDLFPNINQLWPDTKEEIPMLVDAMIASGKPEFLSLKR